MPDQPVHNSIVKSHHAGVEPGQRSTGRGTRRRTHDGAELSTYSHNMCICTRMCLKAPESGGKRI
ncbi:hypothetical protein PY310_21430 [Pseudarthrobacter sp. H3Y2-7]|uniref:hypothetical protein n=1 Tax=Pseudarthrobacter naphthalenicus TaxID=3031328 RepID=UPI0023AFE94A|nr:hypothetical protein [Pseudarthrobacter sp. H3Y2-7]MDE8671111.1 hypothetical protein [Pseudarthrobacter sp. H3Y2-7]